MKFTNVVDTKDLTKSFQWNAGESFEQQDIQVKKIIILIDKDDYFRNSAEFFSMLSNNHARTLLPKTSSANYMKVFNF